MLSWCKVAPVLIWEQFCVAEHNCKAQIAHCALQFLWGKRWQLLHLSPNGKSGEVSTKPLLYRSHLRDLNTKKFQVREGGVYNWSLPFDCFLMVRLCLKLRADMMQSTTLSKATRRAWKPMIIPKLKEDGPDNKFVSSSEKVVERCCADTSALLLSAGVETSVKKGKFEGEFLKVNFSPHQCRVK